MSIALLRMASRSVVVSVLAVGLWLGAAGRVQADPLNPLDFPLSDSGAFPTAAGTYTFDTGALTLTGSGITTPIRGSLSATGVAVFDFNAITVGGAQTFVGTGSSPLALLSRTNATIAGTVDGSGQATTQSNNLPLGGPGGGNGGAFSLGGGPGGGGAGVSVVLPMGLAPIETGGGGGGFGGPGGAGANPFSNIPGVPGGNVPGGPGGVPYGDLLRQLQGGSGGGTSVSLGSGHGGGGGGAIEIGAVDSLAISGSILARGGSSISLSGFLGGGGGGSGGGILLHADSVLLTGSLSAVGGDGGSASFIPGPGGSLIDAGGGGGGGRVTILFGPGGFSEGGATINVAGGAGGAGSPNGSPGGAGVVDIAFVPEPASLVLLGTGVLGLLGIGGMRRRAADA